MGWFFCGCMMVYWFFISECGIKMFIWNVVYNVGGVFMFFFVILGLYFFVDDWKSIFYFLGIFLILVGIYVLIMMKDIF